MTPLQKVLRRVRFDDDGCWTWTGGKSDNGYGNVYINGRSDKTHRVAYRAWAGSIPEGLEIDHQCRNKACVNPMHLEAVTRLVNQRRALRFREPSTRAKRPLKPHCAHGHLYTPETTMWWNGVRNCRTCKNLRARGERRTAELGVIPEEMHGYPTTYSRYGCRCRPCTDAATAVRMAYKRKKRAERALEMAS